MAGSLLHNSINQVPSGNLGAAAENIFAPPAWYFELPVWIADPKAPGNAAHNCPLAMRIRGPFNQEALSQSVQEILRRHGALRSAFRIVDGNLVQLILPVQEVDVPILDLTGLPEKVREGKARQAVLEDTRRPFDLSRGLMLRTLLTRLAAEDHILLLTTHHVVCDYWSTRILIRELFTLYASHNAKQASPLPEQDFQYPDYVKWLEERLRTHEAELMKFWKECLAGKDFHHLAPDHAPPAARSYRGSCERTVFSEQLAKSIQQLAVRERLSPFMIMLAALKCLVQRYSGHGDIGIGSCVANRPLPELEGVIGPFANVSVLRTDLSGNPTGREVFRRVREVCLAAFNYQDAPFGTLVSSYQPAFDPARHPIFQILFVFLNAPSEPWEATGFTVEPMAVDAETSCFELNMNVRLHEQLEIELRYSSDLFDAATIRGLLHDYRAVLESLCVNPEARVGQLAIKKQQTGIKTDSQPGLAVTEYAQAKGDIESQLVQLWEAVLERRSVGVNDNFFELGGDSLRAVRLFGRIEQTFKRAIPLSTLVQSPTVATLARVISDAGSNANPCVVTIQPGDSDPPLFCIPGQTGSVLMFRNLAQSMGRGQAVYGLQPQGLDGKQPPLTSIEDGAANFIRQIRIIQPAGPYILLGYCMGGTIALEMAQQLHTQGETVGLVVLLDTYNWSLLKQLSSIDELYFRVQQWWFSWRPGGLRWRELQKRKGLGPLLSLALPDRTESLGRSSDFWTKPAAELVSECNRNAALAYSPHIYAGRLLHVRPTKQFARYKRTEMSLNQFASQGVEEFFLSGYPAQMLEAPAVVELAARLKAAIEACAPIQGSRTASPAAPTAA